MLAYTNTMVWAEKRSVAHKISMFVLISRWAVL